MHCLIMLKYGKLVQYEFKRLSALSVSRRHEMVKSTSVKSKMVDDAQLGNSQVCNLSDCRKATVKVYQSWGPLLARKIG